MRKYRAVKHHYQYQPNPLDVDKIHIASKPNRQTATDTHVIVCVGCARVVKSNRNVWCFRSQTRMKICRTVYALYCILSKWLRQSIDTSQQRNKYSSNYFIDFQWHIFFGFLNKLVWIWHTWNSFEMEFPFKTDWKLIFALGMASNCWYSSHAFIIWMNTEQACLQHPMRVIATQVLFGQHLQSNIGIHSSAEERQLVSCR